MSYLDDLLGVMATFQDKLGERWQQTFHDSIRKMEMWTPPPVHFQENYNRSPEVWDYRKPEVQAHINYGCAALKWYEDGAKGVVPHCPGTIRDEEHPDNRTVWWDGMYVPVDQDKIDCGIPGLFDKAEEWAYNDQKYIFDICPLFPQGDLEALKEMRGALLRMAGELGGDFEVDGSDPDFQQEITLADQVDYLFGEEGVDKDWRADWTGTTSDRVHDGVFASTKPTLHNHTRIANGLATLINERATIVHTYRKNTINLIKHANHALGEMTEGGEKDTTAFWQTVQAVGMAGACAPPTASEGAAIILVGWLGEKFLGEQKTGPKFAHHPGEVATALHDSVDKMREDLQQSEKDFETDAKEFRTDLNSLPSTFLELYDITENSPTGKH